MTFMRQINHPQFLQEGLNGLINNETYSDTTLLCSDGNLVHNKLTVGLLFPHLGNCAPFLLPVPATLMLPDHTVIEVQAMVARIFGHLNLSLDSLIEQQFEFTKSSDLCAKVFSCSLCCLSFDKLDLLVRHKKLHNVNNVKPVESVLGPSDQVVNDLISPELSSSKDENLSQLSVPKDMCLDSLLWNDDHEKPSIDPCKTTISYNTNQMEEVHNHFDSEEEEENDGIDDAMSEDIIEEENDEFGIKFEPGANKIEVKMNESKRKKETGDKLYSCSFCGKSFPSQGPMLIHERTHTKEYPYSCNYCHRKFNQSWHVKVHERIHTGEKPFMCSDCGKCFASNSTLTSHKVLHRQEKPHKCKFCEKGFNHLSGLRSHENLHTGMDQYMCSECGKTYNNKKNLNRHHCKKDGDVRLKAVNASEEKFMCLECGKEYKTKKILRRHKCLRTFQLSTQNVAIRPGDIIGI